MRLLYIILRQDTGTLETGWKVFEKIEGKESSRWYLWIFQNEESFVFKIRPSRSSRVLTEYFGEDHAGGILNVDSYGAYKVIAKSGLFLLAFCWAHVRRDFVEHSKAYPQQEVWGLAWADRISGLYHLNNQRMQYKLHSRGFNEQDGKLRTAMKEMAEQMTVEMKSELLPPAKKLLKSLSKHWEGLTVFLDYPEVPMGRVEDWRAGTIPTFPVSARQTGRALLTHPAFVQSHTFALGT